MALKTKAEEYFRTINPIASKIQEDIDNTVASYENMWLTLSEKEKIEIINESMIKPEIALTYVALDSLEFDINDPPVRNDSMSFFGRQHGLRTISDENGTYRDEHSAPFIYQTESQLNLCALKEYRSQDKDASTVPVMSELAISHSKVVNELKNALKAQDKLKPVNKGSNSVNNVASHPGFISKIIGNFKCKEEDLECLVSPEIQSRIVESSDFFKGAFKSPINDKKMEKDYNIAKSNSDLSEEQRGLLSSSQTSSRTDFQSMELLTESNLPKTGYDFLDNW